MTDSMISQCPMCGKIANVPAEFAGRTIECGCGATFTLKDDSDKESVQRELIAKEFVVTDYRIGKSKTTDQYLVKFACGFCKGSLILNQKQLANQQQKCKECGKGYRLSKKILADVKEQELTDKRNKEELVLKKQKVKAEKRLARRKREREQQLNVESQVVLPRRQTPQEQYPQEQTPQEQYPQEQTPQEQYPQEQFPQQQFPQQQYPQQQYPQQQVPQQQVVDSSSGKPNALVYVILGSGVGYVLSYYLQSPILRAFCPLSKYITHAPEMLLEYINSKPIEQGENSVGGQIGNSIAQAAAEDVIIKIFGSIIAGGIAGFLISRSTGKRR